MRSLSLLFCLAACGGTKTPPVAPTPTEPTAAEAKVFIEAVDAKLHRLWAESEGTAWDLATDIKPENEARSAAAEVAVMAYMSEVIPQASRFDGLTLDPDVARQLSLLKLASSLPAPSDAAKRTELADISTGMGSMYGKGQWCPEPGATEGCLDLGDLEGQIGDVKSSPADRLLAWQRWREVSVAMKPMYARFVELGNEGASEIGYTDMGAQWRSHYDMSPAEFETEVDRLYEQVAPLYEALHCHVRAELNEDFGDEVVPADGLIPAHLTGNMWAQSWELLYPEMTPYPDEPSLDVTKQLVDQDWDAIKMTKSAESFFVGMGLDPLPETFWERSMLTKPDDREVECHASAWDIGMKDDLRIKMCIKPTMDDLYTLHHELGHNYYFHYYYDKPVLFQNGAHDGFHEAIGDAVMLSVTPAYLAKLGLLEEVSDSEEAVINKQFNDGLNALAFLPFGRMIDQWRWDVFSGKVPPDEYNAHWWKLRDSFQGIGPGADRPADAFDPGAKYHIPGNTPYMRYFLAAVLKYQIYSGMCEAAGHTGPLHECTFDGSTEAGDRLRAMLSMGASRPWPDALEAVAGTRQMDAAPMLEYYAPLRAWLAEQNENRTCGW